MLKEATKKDIETGNVILIGNYVFKKTLWAKKKQLLRTLLDFFKGQN